MSSAILRPREWRVRPGRHSGTRATLAGVLASLALATGLAARPGAAHAGVPDSAYTEDAELRDKYLLGDWMGARTWLWEHGVKPKFLLLSDPYGNPVGGKGQGLTAYNLFCADLKLDTAKLVGLPGGEFHVGFSVNFGRQLSQDVVGSVFPIQASDVAPPGTRLTILSYTQSLLDDLLSIRAGRVAIDSLYGQEFAASWYFRSFTSVAFNAIPFAIFYDSPGAFGYPATTWGARAKVTPNERWYAMAGIYNGDPDVGRADRHGVDFSFDGPPYGIGEVGYRRNQGAGDVGLEGNLKVGGFVLGGDVKRYDSTRSSSGRGGVYVVADQVIVRFGGADENRHLGVFGSLVVAPDEAVSPMPYYVNGGMVAYGPFASRPKDYVSLGFAYGAFSSRLRDQQVAQGVLPQFSETTIELSWGIHVLPGLILQPGTQVLIHPGGNPGTPSGLALGLNAIIAF